MSIIVLDGNIVTGDERIELDRLFDGALTPDHLVERREALDQESFPDDFGSVRVSIGEAVVKIYNSPPEIERAVEGPHGWLFELGQESVVQARNDGHSRMDVGVYYSPAVTRYTGVDRIAIIPVDNLIGRVRTMMVGRHGEHELTNDPALHREFSIGDPAALMGAEVAADLGGAVRYFLGSEGIYMGFERVLIYKGFYVLEDGSRKKGEIKIVTSGEELVITSGLKNA